MGKILSISERKPVQTTLEDGVYTGLWGGYVITINYKGKTYELTTEEGVKGINIGVVVTITNGVGTYSETKN